MKWKSCSLMTASMTMVLITGCASSGEQYPSLAVRNVERTAANAVPAAPLSAAPLSHDNIQRSSQFAAQARASHSKFLNAISSARLAVRRARGASTASDAWSSAQIALADLQSIRSVTAVPLADLDRLYVEATVDFVQRQAIIRDRDTVIDLVTQEDRALSELGSVLDR